MLRPVMATPCYLKNDWTDRLTDGRQTVTLCFPLEAARVKSNYKNKSPDDGKTVTRKSFQKFLKAATDDCNEGQIV